MRRRGLWGAAIGSLFSLLAAGCTGGDSKISDDGDEGTETDKAPSTRKGECKKGEYPGDHDTLTLCGEAATSATRV